MASRRNSRRPSTPVLQKPEDTSTSSSSSEDVSAITLSADNSEVTAQVLNDGTVSVKLSEKAFRITKRLQARAHLSALPIGPHLTRNNKNYETSFQSVLGRYTAVPKLCIAIHIVGSRGDVQPFITIGQILQKEPYGHRVRICTHPVFKHFVEENGLEFFSIGGDPATLMAYMVKNPGLMPGRESWKAGDVRKRRADMAEILEGCWRSCIEPGDGMGGDRKCNVIDPKTEAADRLFVADAIIANPPSYGHLHCAEKLGIPLHMMFTMPWTPTTKFPHPLANLERNDSDPNLANFISYTLMELLAWQGLGDVINGFRMKTLNLDPISPLWGHMLLDRMKVPFTYAWSSSLIPKPPDWGSHINISGFSFLKSPDTYVPPPDLVKFLEAGEPPVYIGFGSIVVDDPNALTDLIFSAVKLAGVRALVSKGWGGLGGSEPPENVFLLDNTPHDWLFQYVSCVVHHGGAGTSAIGIAMGKPTIVVPFFGDQPFWGAMIFRAGAGPEPIPYKTLTADNLASSITRALEPDIKKAVGEMGDKIAGEDGAANAAASFHQSLNFDSMRCLLSPERVAVWRLRKTTLRLSALAAATLIDNGHLELKDLKLVKHRDWYIDEGASNPLIGALASISGTLTNTVVTFSTYTHDLHNTLHAPAPNTARLSTATTPDQHELARYPTLSQIPSRFPLQAALHYPPEHISRVAYRMASKKLPSSNNKTSYKKKYKKAYSFDPSHRSASHASSSKPHNHKHGHKHGHGHGHGHEHSKAHDAAHETGTFTVSIIRTGLKAPVAFLYNLANGFHNAPSFVLHDETVRRRDNITSVYSGAKVAGKGFFFNLLDSVTGLVYLPYLGAQKEGLVGFGKGIGKGLGGVVFKTTAAVLGVPAYTFKGIEKQVRKRFDRELKSEILEVRLRQGLAAYGRATEEEKEEILRRWKEFDERA